MTVPGAIIAPSADRDVDEQIDYYFSRQSVETAFRFLDAVKESIRQIVTTPGIGGHYEGAPTSIQGLRVCRVKGFKNHLIFYRIREDSIEVVRVVHGARDLDEVLRST